MSRPIAQRFSAAVTVILALVMALAIADLFRTLWRARVLHAQIARGEDAIAQARAEIADVKPLRARRDRLRLRLLHGRRTDAGAWLADVERAAECHGLSLLAVHPLEDSRQAKVPAGFVRHGVELRLHGEWASVARWIRDLGSIPGIVAVDRLWLEPVHDARDHALDVRGVVEFYTPQEGGSSV